MGELRRRKSPPKELKGNIRVFCRVRPLLRVDGPGAEPQSQFHFCQKYPFTFDKVFAHDASQQDIFQEISQLVQSALDGYKVSIFAYGQTGSGKTYTMMGRPEAPLQKGMIPRSLEQASMLEIYNEKIQDLLANKRNAGAKQYNIRHAEGNTYVSDLTIVDVCSIGQVSNLLQKAAHRSTEQQVQGVLNFIDLAGSERLSRSGATGERLKETQYINKSLSSLTDVFSFERLKDWGSYPL
ncbi:kinesin-like protein KIN-14C [Tanacetum coccineum]|uniref:Kinesin-like protein KIN-14C n=1 Tax=Tanacetum coccineum TaxID=301880 RepID=A0ABQ4XEQ5_9ASTR